MQVITRNVILPTVVLDAYLTALTATLDPILKEEDLPAKTQYDLLNHAFSATLKATVQKHLAEFEAAGLYEGVTSPDYPDFKWTRSSKILYACDMFVGCFARSMAAEVAGGRDITEYLEILSISSNTAIEKTVCDLLEKSEHPSVRRLEEHVYGICKANNYLMLGTTSHNLRRVLTNVVNNVRNGTDPLANLEEDMDILYPDQVVYL